MVPWLVRPFSSYVRWRLVLKRILVISVGFTIVYLVISNFEFPENWHNQYVASSTQYRFSGIIGREEKDRQIGKGKPRSELINPIENPENERNNNNSEELNYLITDASAHYTKSLIYSIFKSTQEMPQCPTLMQNPLLDGHVGQASLLIEELEEEEVSRFNSDLKPGGSWKPENCTARYKVAIIIPYRDRKSHLVRLLDFLIPILKKQQLDFRFIVTEQKGEDLFNKGRIMNAAFRYASENLKVNCVIFHDVDMFPQDDRTPYECPSNGPRHVGAFVSTLGYQLWYQEIVGGVLAINVEDYLIVNGFSNSYWAWGGEDDDMGKRILAHNYTIDRPNSDFVRFTMLKHVKRKRLAPKLIYKLLQETEKRMKTDGVNEPDKWNISKIDVRPLYYHLLVDVGDPPSVWKS